MWSATASTSRSLCVMKMIDLPFSTRVRTTPKNSSTSPGVRTAVGSSRMRMSASRYSALISSTRCCSPTDSVSTTSIGVDLEPVLRAQLADAGAGPVEVEHRAASRLVAQHDVLHDGEHRDELEVLVHHPDPRRDRIPGAAELHGLAAEEDLALVGLVQPEHRVHERALAGAVLAEEAQDLALAQRQVDVLVGDDPGEPLGEPRTSRIGWTGVAHAPPEPWWSRRAGTAARAAPARRCDRYYCGSPVAGSSPVLMRAVGEALAGSPRGACATSSGMSASWNGA